MSQDKSQFGVSGGHIESESYRLMRSYTGVIHVGANAGHERDLYAACGLNVLWVEPIPAIFQELQRRLAGYPKQQALQYLVLDADDRTMKLHISSNDGLSSSILDLKLHKDIWPTVSFVDDLELKSITLDSIVQNHAIDLANYDSLVMDTQGSELLILQGASTTLSKMKMVQVEAADFEAYANCPAPSDFLALLGQYGFKEWKRTPFASHPAGGRYFDIVYVREGGTSTDSISSA